MNSLCTSKKTLYESNKPDTFKQPSIGKLCYMVLRCKNTKSSKFIQDEAALGAMKEITEKIKAVITDTWGHNNWRRGSSGIRAAYHHRDKNNIPGPRGCRCTHDGGSALAGVLYPWVGSSSTATRGLARHGNAALRWPPRGHVKGRPTGKGPAAPRRPCGAGTRRTEPREWARKLAVDP